MAVVGDPLLAEDFEGPFFVEVGFGGIVFVAEGVGRGAESDDGLAGFGVVEDRLELGIGEVAETGEDDHEVGGFEGFGAGEVVGGVGVDVAIFVEAVEDGDAAVEFAEEDAGEHRHGLFGAVFLVAGDKDDVGFGVLKYFHSYKGEAQHLVLAIIFSMPVYEYRCQACGRRCELLMGMTAEPDDESCPHCGQKKLVRTVSRFRKGRTEDQRVDEMADRLEEMGEPDSPSQVRQMVKEMGRAMDDDMGDEMEEMFESDMDNPELADE